MKYSSEIIVVLIVALIYIFFFDDKENDSKFNDITRVDSKINRVLPSIGDVEDNLLVNGDFEEALSGWSYESGVFWSDNGGTDNSGALLINPPEIERISNGIYAKNVRQCVPISGTSEYAIEAQFRYLDTLPDRLSVNRIHIYWMDNIDCSSGGQYGTFLEPSFEKNVWQNRFLTRLKPSLGAKAAEIRIEQRQDGNNSAEAIWDNILFLETKKSQIPEGTEVGNKIFDKVLGTNYLDNPNFDQDISSWSLTGFSEFERRTTSDLKHGGVLSATLPNERDGGIGIGSFSQCINLGTSGRYELGAQVMIAPESVLRGGGRLRPAWYEDLDCKGRHRTSGRHDDIDRDVIDWQDLHVDELIPQKGSKSVYISIIHSIDGKGEHTLLWDNFYFRAY